MMRLKTIKTEGGKTRLGRFVSCPSNSTRNGYRRRRRCVVVRLHHRTATVVRHHCRGGAVPIFCDGARFWHHCRGRVCVAAASWNAFAGHANLKSNSMNET